MTSEVLRAFLRALFVDQRRRARRVHGISRGHSGSVTFIQRFGSALNLTPRFHTLVLDGVYPGPSHDLGSFVSLLEPTCQVDKFVGLGLVELGAIKRACRISSKSELGIRSSTGAFVFRWRFAICPGENRLLTQSVLGP